MINDLKYYIFYPDCGVKDNKIDSCFNIAKYVNKFGEFRFIEVTSAQLLVIKLKFNGELYPISDETFKKIELKIENNIFYDYVALEGNHLMEIIASIV